MLKYVKICQDDGEEIPPLVYKITELNTHNKKKK